MAGAWGPSDTMKEAQGFPREMGAWSFEQFKEFLARAQSQGITGDALAKFAQDFFADKARFGNGSPEEIQKVGEQISPGVQAAIDSRRGRLNTITGEYGNAQDRVREGYEGIESDLNNTDQWSSGDINSTYSRMNGRNDDATKQVVGNLGDSYGAAEEVTGNAYNDMRRKAGETYAGLGTGADEAYGTADKTLAQLKPGGEFQAARVGRSFAPQVAATMRRLRASGVDPNSGEAAERLKMVESSRARAMDDASAAATTGYVDRKNSLTLDKYNTKSGLTREGLTNDQNLGRESTSIHRGLILDKGKDFRGEVVRNQGIANGIDQGWMNDTIRNRNETSGKRSSLLKDKQGWALTDWGTQANLGREQNAEDITALGLKDAQFDRGMQFVNNDTNVKSQGAGMVANLGAQAQQQGNTAAQLARGFGGDAAANYGQAWQYEAPNAGWATKAIAGMVAAPMNMIAPGSGQNVQAWGNGISGGAYPPQQGGGQYGGGWGGGKNPYIWS